MAAGQNHAPQATKISLVDYPECIGIVSSVRAVRFQQATKSTEIISKLLYLMKSLLAILVGLGTCSYWTDLGAKSTFQSIVAPLGVFLFLVTMVCWIVLKLHSSGINQYTDGSGSDPGSFFGGDGGGGDC